LSDRIRDRRRRCQPACEQGTTNAAHGVERADIRDRAPAIARSFAQKRAVVRRRRPVHQPFAGGAREWAQRLWRTQDGRAVSPLLDLYLRTGESRRAVE
jgi:hypothetical protein